MQPRECNGIDDVGEDGLVGVRSSVLGVLHTAELASREGNTGDELRDCDRVRQRDVSDEGM